MKILWYLSLLVVTCRAEDPVLATVTWDKQGGYDIVENQLLSGNNVAAWINFTNTINQTGWSYLEVKTNDALPDQIQVRTKSRSPPWTIYCDMDTSICPMVMDFRFRDKIRKKEEDL